MRSTKTPWRVAGGFLLCVLAGVWLVYGPFGIMCYIGGLFNWMPVFVGVFVGMLPALVFAAAFPVLVVRALVTWRRRTQAGRRRIAFWVVLAGGFIVPFVMGIVIGLTPSPFDMYVRGFTRHAQRRVDAEAIRNWLAALDPNDPVCENGTMYGQLAESDRPPCIAELAPVIVFLEPDDAGRPMVRLLWGSGMIGSWGVAVGREDMPTPAVDRSARGERYYPLGPGTYVWSGN
jgi:hypothetical protein